MTLFEKPLQDIVANIDKVLGRSRGFEVGQCLTSALICEITEQAQIIFEQAMVLVGGFAESRYLRTALQSRLKLGVKQINIDEATCVLPYYTMGVSHIC